MKPATSPSEEARPTRETTVAFSISQALLRALAPPRSRRRPDEILARIEGENNRRHLELKVYSGLRQYTMQNLRFGKQAWSPSG